MVSRGIQGDWCTVKEQFRRLRIVSSLRDKKKGLSSRLGGDECVLLRLRQSMIEEHEQNMVRNVIMGCKMKVAVVIDHDTESTS